MPRTCLDTADAIELAETLQLIAGWLTADPERLTIFNSGGYWVWSPGARCAVGIGDSDRPASRSYSPAVTLLGRRGSSRLRNKPPPV
jgi:hypothetical protein